VRSYLCEWNLSQLWAAVLNSSIGGFVYFSRAAILRAAGGKALAAEHWSTLLRFEGHAVALAALIANYLEPFAFCSALARPAKVLAPRVAAGLATLRMAEAALAIVVLFSFSKGKTRSAFGTSDFKVWHRYLPEKDRLQVDSLSLSAEFTARSLGCTEQFGKRQLPLCSSCT
jgi:hypothetical protein